MNEGRRQKAEAEGTIGWGIKPYPIVGSASDNGVLYHVRLNTYTGLTQNVKLYHVRLNTYTLVKGRQRAEGSYAEGKENIALAFPEPFPNQNKYLSSQQFYFHLIIIG
ncbi:MAG: hypothetical protein F6K39_24615 [Okeania sp. SIO3B3]|nr:hypothetical protein [Okeania sp. SIO3B3]